MPVQRPTQSGKLSDVARHVVLPSGIVSTSWPAVRDKCRDLGIAFDPWQDGAGRIILAKRADGTYAASIGGTVISIPRQVGKTFLIGSIVFALCLLYPGLTVIWTAHRLRTAGETFSSMQSLARRKKIKPFVAKVVLGSGEEEVRFTNGSRILFGARERGFGRGFSEVDVLVFDEAQILTENAIDDMVPATNQAKHPAGALVLFTGTPPKPTDPGEVFRRKRKEALSGEDQDTGYIEFSADPDADPDDWAQVRKANPSHPKRTPREAILRMRKNLSLDSYLREGLGVWDEEGKQLVMPRWPDGAVDSFPLEPVGAVGLAVSVDREWGAIGAADKRDGVMHVGTVRREPGTHWLAEEARRIYKTYGCPIIIDSRGPGADLIDDLQDAGAWVVEANTQQYLDGCAELFDGVAARKVLHMSDDSELNTAVSGAGKRPVGDRWAWSRTKSTSDVSVLEAVTLAAWGVNYIGGGVILG